ncbi:hypothetical protein CDAR_164301 [Caerostris darwini]|uniref:Uncharacterized protein n=1 Tax=Caerostris darwini TaxID=1538125 RepID=A0AAV4X494_9ARAC|nr:hypothetical protein CDAR_164301 [Caerostris darwini]
MPHIILLPINCWRNGNRISNIPVSEGTFGGKTGARTGENDFIPTPCTFPGSPRHQVSFPFVIFAARSVLVFIFKENMATCSTLANFNTLVQVQIMSFPSFLKRLRRLGSF